ncbi:hypothetical protein [Winogradskyella helgolandensis]|uniref:hypothetical protein n=1 Tax=Winogradskyella helgolandensis TaxID=2697010 RepID=UPI0015CD55E9|nr:hypothetical protein [Winogradskyella helgolandensis]
MVRIINYKERQVEDGSNFFVLELQGGVEMVKSQQTNQFYATAKKSFITSTFDEETCKALIGTSMPGNIEKQSCEPYQYTVRETGEMIILEHRYVYVPEGESQSKEDKAVQELLAEEHTFSQNGVLEEELMD